MRWADRPIQRTLLYSALGEKKDKKRTEKKAKEKAFLTQYMALAELPLVDLILVETTTE